MKKGFLKFVAVFMAVLMTAVYLPLAEIDTVFDVEASAIVTNGKVNLGANIKWTYDNKSKTITVSGSGAMNNFKNGDDGQRWDELILGLTHYPNKHAENLVIESGITSIGNHAFNGLKGIKKVTIPDSVKTIGVSAFEGCSALTSVKIPSAVTVINNNTFYGCSSLSSVNINEGVTSIGANAFRDTAVSSVTMPYSVKSIGSNAFSTVRITCNYGDPAYNYCKSHANATAVLRAPSLRAEITQGAQADLINVTLYIQNASGFNAGNFTAEYNNDISPVSSEATYTDSNNVATAVVYGSNNTVSIAVAALTNISYDDCSDRCEYKIAELSFRLNAGTHVAKVTFASSVLLLADKRYTPASSTVEFGDHKFETVGAPVAATCTEDGYTLKKCSLCNEERKFDIVPALGHAYGKGVVTAPTCEAEGYTSYTCSRCNDVRTDSYTDETGHSIKEVLIAATCTEKGRKSAVCEWCKRETVIEEYDINPDNHVETETVNVKAATCTEKGYSGDEKCKACDKIVKTGAPTDVIPHTYRSVVTASTCTEKGYTTHTCTVCSYSFTDTETPLAPHTYRSVVTAPTCTQKGYTTHTCTVCSYSFKNTETAVVAHEYVRTVKTPATCTKTGVAVYDCKNCDASYNEDIPVTEHNFVETSKTEATCRSFSKTVYTCNGCGETKTVEGDKYAAHDYEATVTAPTCTAAGYTEYVCKVCARSYKDAPTAALGHEYADGHCIRCGEEEVVEATGLVFNDTEKFIVSEDAKTVLVRKPVTISDFKAAITTEGWTVTKADGTAVADDKAVATSYIVTSADGSLVYSIAILGDITGDGKITAADARIALRVTARIDTADAVGVLALDADNSGKITAADARIILRVSARIQEF